jgi:hypothetical protein
MQSAGASQLQLNVCCIPQKIVVDSSPDKPDLNIIQKAREPRNLQPARSARKIEMNGILLAWRGSKKPATRFTISQHLSDPELPEQHIQKTREATAAQRGKNERLEAAKPLQKST